MAGKRSNSFFLTVINDCLQIIKCFRDFPSIFFKHSLVIINTLIHSIVNQAICFSINGNILSGCIQTPVKIGTVNFTKNTLWCIS